MLSLLALFVIAVLPFESRAYDLVIIDTEDGDATYYLAGNYTGVSFVINYTDVTWSGTWHIIVGNNVTGETCVLKHLDNDPGHDIDCYWYEGWAHSVMELYSNDTEPSAEITYDWKQVLSGEVWGMEFSDTILPVDSPDITKFYPGTSSPVQFGSIDPELIHYIKINGTVNLVTDGLITISCTLSQYLQTNLYPAILAILPLLLILKVFKKLTR
jgi:hypothetical protein